MAINLLNPLQRRYITALGTEPLRHVLVYQAQSDIRYNDTTLRYTCITNQLFVRN